MNKLTTGSSWNLYSFDDTRKFQLKRSPRWSSMTLISQDFSNKLLIIFNQNKRAPTRIYMWPKALIRSCMMLKKRTISPPPPSPSPYHIYMNQIYRWEHTYTKIYNYIEFLSCYTLISSKKKKNPSQFPPQNKHQKKIKEKRVRLRMMTQQTR
jgi:hypothetical protein